MPSPTLCRTCHAHVVSCCGGRRATCCDSGATGTKPQRPQRDVSTSATQRRMATSVSTSDNAMLDASMRMHQINNAPGGQLCQSLRVSHSRYPGTDPNCDHTITTTCCSWGLIPFHLPGGKAQPARTGTSNLQITDPLAADTAQTFLAARGTDSSSSLSITVMISKHITLCWLRLVLEPSPVSCWFWLRLLSSLAVCCIVNVKTQPGDSSSSSKSGHKHMSTAAI